MEAPKTTRKYRISSILKALLRIGFITLVIFTTILFVRAFDTRKMLDLEKWHRVELTNEFHKSIYGSDLTYPQYKQLEDKLFAELEEKVYLKTAYSEQEKYNRYMHESFSCPDRFPQNWNRSYELIPEKIKGGVLLVHGLTDSPYSMKALAEKFYDAGFYVLALRMPGHGTIPAGLVDATWQDWMAALKIGARYVSRNVGDGNPFYIAGYSNGGALSLLYTLESLEDKKLAKPDRLFLFSPAIGITKFAAIAPWLQMTSAVPYFEKSKWNSIDPEYDPFKYNSFPLNAAEQSYRLSKKLKDTVAEYKKEGVLAELPPVITFQSAVDSTVITKDVVWFYDQLPTNEHELVIFGVNQKASLRKFLKVKPLEEAYDSIQAEKLNYKLAIITNLNPDVDIISARIREERADHFDEIELDFSWPENVYSLSHLAIPFPENDPLYGLTPANDSFQHVQLGNINMRGERNVLRIPEKDIMRLRCNPFWQYVWERINEAIAFE